MADTPEMQARIKQTAHMMAGCKNRLKEMERNTLATVSDSIDAMPETTITVNDLGTVK